MNDKNLTDESDVRHLVESGAMAVRRQNLEEILANHSADMLLFDVPAPIQSKGLEAYRKSWGVFFPWFQDSGIFDVTELSITAGEDVGFATALVRCGGKEANCEKTELGVRLTVCLRKIGGRWTVLHEHHSVPAS